MGKINKLSLPAVILIASIILGGFYFLSQVSKQKSIEKQQQTELQAKKEQDKRDYIAKRKVECFAIYKSESEMWNHQYYTSVLDWSYHEPTENPFETNVSDTCEIFYQSIERGRYSKYY